MRTSINITRAIEQLGGSTNLYLHVLKRFKEKYSHIDKNIEELVIAGDFLEARRLVHSIKGLSGNLGSKQLEEKAKELEKCYAKGKGENQMVFDRFSSELHKVLKEIDILITELPLVIKEVAIVKEND